MLKDSTYDQHPPDRELGPTVLLVDDEPHARDRLELALGQVELQERVHILHCDNLRDAIKTVSSIPVHVVLLDKNLGHDELDPSQNGIEAIPELIQLQPHLQVLMVTGSNDTQDVVRALKLGAFGYVTKDSPDELLVTQIDRAIRVAVLTLDKTRRERSSVAEDFDLGGSSRVFQNALHEAHLLSESNRPVLLLGETGTGKTAVAKWINQCRARFLKQKDRPFFSVNIATLTRDLAESELFGHERGAFTGAVSTKQGLFELANNGTLFLDEIGELSPDLQAKLLTVIEEGTFMRVGGSKQLRAMPKLIFATNRNLEQMVEDGQFRRDLYMRICMFPIHLPPLSERKQDIPQILRSLIKRSSRENHVAVGFEDIPKDFIDHLMNNPVEGNIRGLQNQLDRLLVLCPRDRKGRPIFSRWRSVPGLYQKRPETRQVAHASPNAPLTLQDFLSRKTDVLGPGFPGLAALLEEVTSKVLAEAITKFEANNSIARAIGMSKGYTSVLLKRQKARPTETLGAGALTENQGEHLQ